jgi:hypothetical protein
MTDEDIWKKKEIRSARMNALNNATRLVCSLIDAGYYGGKLSADSMLARIEEYSQKIYGLIFQGMEQDGGLNLENNTPFKDQQKPSVPVCSKCGKEVTQDVVNWCESHKEKYGGKIYCRECQI